MWTYSQSSGELFDPAGKRVDSGWSGQGECRNNPQMQHVRHRGPICRGLYTIQKAIRHHKLGKCVMRLTPHPENEMYGRSAFCIHGYSKDNPETEVNEMLLSSQGCIIMVLWVRELIDASNDKLLQVIL